MKFGFIDDPNDQKLTQKFYLLNKKEHQDVDFRKSCHTLEIQRSKYIKIDDKINTN